jgi:cell division GTPase FtsZ
MFKTKDVLNSLEQIISPKEITADTLALELANVISDNGSICLDKADIEKALKNSNGCNYNILINTIDAKIKSADILNDKNIDNVKTLILIIKHNGSLSLFKISELMDDIKENLPNSDIELLIGDYIDKNTNEIKVTTLILK